MATFKLTWNGDELMEKLEEAVIVAIAEAFLKVYVSQLNIELTEVYSPPPSQPGEPPHAVRGMSSPESLVNSTMIWAIPDECRVIVGSMSEYAMALELGTGRMEARPVWQKTLIERMDVLAEEIARRAKDNLEIYLPPLNENQNLNPFSTMTSQVPNEVPQGRSDFLPSLR